MYIINKLKQVDTNNLSKVWEGTATHDVIVWIMYINGVFEMVEGKTIIDLMVETKSYKQLIKIVVGSETDNNLSDKEMLEILTSRGIKVTDQEFLNACNQND